MGGDEANGNIFFSAKAQGIYNINPLCHALLRPGFLLPRAVGIRGFDNAPPALALRVGMLADKAGRVAGAIQRMPSSFHYSVFSVRQNIATVVG